jgi:uncharacterized protein YjbI with pentapeptide repeats
MSPEVAAAIIAASVSLLTLLGTLAAQYFGRRATSRDTQKALEEQREQLKQTLDEQRGRTLNERFATAAGQLGNNQPPAVRLAGVYAMAGLADDWEKNRQTCIDVLCAYLRLPYDRAPAEDTSRSDHLDFRASREVRHTVIKVISAHLMAGAAVSWRGFDFDFSDVVFDGGDFRDAIFSGSLVVFDGAEFAAGAVHFSRAKFSSGRVFFGSAKFSGGRVRFKDAEFSGGIVSFRRTDISAGSVEFINATFSGGTVLFTGSAISGGRVSFDEATFAGGTVDFGQAKFTGGTVDFGGADFSGSEVSFFRAEFRGTAVTGQKKFDVLSGGPQGSLVSFRGARFAAGAVSFRGALITPAVEFSQSMLLPDGDIDFRDAFFSGTVDLRDANWSHRPRFDWAAEDAPPVNLLLPGALGPLPSQ